MDKTEISWKDKTVLVTGAAGFIGANLVKRLLDEGMAKAVVGVDNMNAYYDVSLKEYRLGEIGAAAASSKTHWQFVRGDIADRETLDGVFRTYRPALVVNLAAQVTDIDVDHVGAARVVEIPQMLFQFAAREHDAGV